MSNLTDQIEFLRKKMVNLGMSKGLRHPDVLKVSQDLDDVINKYFIATLKGTLS